MIVKVRRDEFGPWICCNCNFVFYVERNDSIQPFRTDYNVRYENSMRAIGDPLAILTENYSIRCPDCGEEIKVVIKTPYLRWKARTRNIHKEPNLQL